LARQHGVASAPILRISHWLPSSFGKTIDCVFDTHPGLTHHPAAVIVPGHWAGEQGLEIEAHLTSWFTEKNFYGPTLCSIREGIFPLTEAGLLAGHTVTAHWESAQVWARPFSGILLSDDKIMAEVGDIIAAGGIVAWSDLGLALIRRYLGPSTMLATARCIVANSYTGDELFFSKFSPIFYHGDGAIFRVQKWLVTSAITQPTIPQMAAIGGLAAGTFVRRFRRATGLNPTGYNQRLRIEKACELLEFTDHSVSSIAGAVGYEDPAFFRKVFMRLVGVLPSVYRDRCGKFHIGKSRTSLEDAAN
jgi:transcriptional regulator GlxA family with amidase domain